ncbi:MAG: LytTR family DNA-binding domain-containing protein [Bacteroidales bacterium]|nr:LytTR family DNA-binding domain-containing protein [Bacteroidales bacterium]
MEILIVEDEQAVAKRLIKLISDLEPEFNILGVIDSVEEAVQWFAVNPSPDLLFMDIHLADGLSFEIFEKVNISIPVIFTTAYDSYAIQAFKVNSVDYLLKPINKEELRRAFAKLRQIHSSAPMAEASVDYQKLAAIITGRQNPLQTRILVRFGQKFKSIEIKDVACFYTENKTVYLHTFANDRYPIDDRLDSLEEVLDKAKYFRINRSTIINFDAIDEMEAYTKSRVHITLKKPLDISFVSSTERSGDFKDWLSGKKTGG